MGADERESGHGPKIITTNRFWQGVCWGLWNVALVEEMAGADVGH